MKATAELQVIPIGNNVSVRQEITHVVELLQAYDFILETHASDTLLRRPSAASVKGVDT